MASKAEGPPEAILGRHRFTNWREQAGVDNKESSPDNQPQQATPFPHVTGNTHPANAFPYDFRRPEAYERMAADKPGEEMAHDATIWKLYLEEADEHDQELVKGLHGGLDMLLLFAALFSAILTAFLIESKDLLQQDSADTSTTLLLMIAQSQQRVELGLPAPETTVLIDVPPFSPPMSARWINGIWFCSLGFSLSAALLAMLAKEWLTAYLSSRPRPAHSHALLRQSRLEGLEKWWALHIIALLPSLLHLSLLLFSVGLVVYLWSLDVAIAAVITTISVVTFLFYMVTAVLGAFYDYCPYVTQISGYLKRAMARYRSSRTSTQGATSSHTSLPDLRALLWLANNARDPAVVDCSYQALAGLRLPAGSPQSTHTDTSPEAGNGPGWVDPRVLFAHIDDQTNLGSIFLNLCERFTRLTHNQEDLSSSNWANAARYMRAITELAIHLRKWDPVSLFRGQNDIRKEVSHRIGQSAPPLIEVLNGSNNLWSDNGPALHADVYASFVANELLLISLAFLDGSQAQSSVQRGPSVSSSGPKIYELLPQAAHTIELTVFNQEAHLPSLLAHYSRALTRASTLMRLHARNSAQIGELPLTRLLGALRDASTRLVSNPTTSHNTHRSQLASDNTQDIRLTTLGSTLQCLYEPENLDRGLLGALINLLLMSPKGQEEPVFQIRVSAVQTLSRLAPAILQQMLGLEKEELLREFDYATWLEGPIADLDAIRYLATRQMLLVLQYLGTGLSAHPGHIGLCHLALELIENYVIENLTWRKAAFLALAHSGKCIVPLLESFGASDSTFTLLSRRDAFILVDIIRLGLDQQRTNLCDTVLPPSCFPPVMRMIRLSQIDDDTVKQLINSVVARMRNSGDDSHLSTVVTQIDVSHIQYLHTFTHLAGCFAGLADAGLDKDYLELAIEATTQIVHLAAGRDPGLVVEQVELRAAAVPGFLDAVSMVAKHCKGVSQRDEMLLGFSRDVVSLLDVASKDDESRRRIVEHPMRDALYASLEDIEDSNAAKELLEQMLKIEVELKPKNQTAQLQNTSSDINSDTGTGPPGEDDQNSPNTPGDLSDHENDPDEGDSRAGDE